MTTYENLVYPMLDSYDSIQNVLLIDQSALQSQVFYDSANTASYPILYNSLTKREDLSQLLSRFTHLDRIAFVFHGIYPGCYYDKPFLEEQPVFTLDGSGSVIVSENVAFVQTLISTFTVSHVDFLGCNLLLSEEWLKYFDVLSANGCTVGASNDQTGNLKYGGDWILENTMENVQNIYFTSQIEDYSDLLVTTAITTNKTLTQSGTELTDGTTTYNWTANGPIPISGSNITVKFGGNINITTAAQTFNITGSNVTVDGSNNIVTVNNFASFPGLFNIASSLNNITLQNIKIVGSSAQPTSGILVGPTTTIYPDGFNILNCSVTGSATITQNSGIFCGINTNIQANFPTFGNTTVENCFNTIPIGSIQYQSGFFSHGQTVRSNARFNMTNCYNSADIGPSAACSGLIGTNFTINTNAIVTLTNCFNTGNIIGGSQYSSALVNPDIIFNSNSSILNLTNCYNTGNFTNVSNAFNYGLISGFKAGSVGGNINLTNCYNTGTMTNGGALINLTSTTPANCYINIINSYSTAVAPLVGGALTNVTLTNTFSTAGGSWTDSSANAALTGIPSSIYNPGTVWASMSANTPYILSSITGTLYSPNTASVVVNTYTTGAAAFGTNLTLVSVNSANPATYATINATTGVISFSNLSAGTYLARVLSYRLTNSKYTNYVFSTFTIFGPLYQANAYNHTFYTYSSANPTVLTQTVYNAAGGQQSVTDMSFGGQNIQTVLTALDVAPYTVGIRDTSNNKVSMDLAFFGAYNTTLTTTQQNAMITYVNTNYKEPRTAATTYAVTVADGVFNINGSYQNLTFVSGNLYVFDQSSPTNVGNLLVLGTTLDVSSSIVGNNVIYNGTPGSANAYTLIDLSGTNPATTSLKYFSLTTTGMGYTQPTVKYVVGGLNWNGTYNVTNDSLENGNTMAYSFNGISWNGLGLLFQYGCNSIAYGNGRWVAGGRSDAHDMMSSTDGITWSRIYITGTTPFFSVGPPPYYATYSDFKIDGPGCNKVIFMNNKFVAIGSTNLIYYSTDGIAWSSASTTSYMMVDITYNGYYWIASDYSDIWYSSNLTSWTKKFANVGYYNHVSFRTSNTTMGCFVPSGYYNNTQTTSWTAKNNAITIATQQGNYNVWSGYAFNNEMLLIKHKYNYVIASDNSPTVYYPDTRTLLNPVSFNPTLDDGITYVKKISEIFYDKILDRWIIIAMQGVLVKNTKTFSSNADDIKFKSITNYSAVGSAITIESISRGTLFG